MERNISETYNNKLRYKLENTMSDASTLNDHKSQLAKLRKHASSHLQPHTYNEA